MPEDKSGEGRSLPLRPAAKQRRPRSDKRGIDRGGQFGQLASAVWRDKLTLISLIILTTLLVAAVFPGFVAPYDHTQQDLLLRNLPPLSPNPHGGFPHIFGTDTLGRDVLSRVIRGSQTSMAVGGASVLVSGTLGSLLGVVAGFKRGRIDDILMRLADIQLSFPTVLLALFVLFMIGGGLANVVLILAVVRWPVYARVARGMTMSLRETAFVEASTAIGSSTLQQLRWHVVPNLLSPIVVLATLEIARVMLAEASLSFLGLGIQPPDTSWGLQIAQGREYVRVAWWLVTIPGFFIFLAALSVNLLASWVRAVTDPVQRWRWVASKTSASEADS